MVSSRIFLTTAVLGALVSFPAGAAASWTTGRRSASTRASICTPRRDALRRLLTANEQRHYFR
jgi:hypothetical protein